MIHPFRERRWAAMHAVDALGSNDAPEAFADEPNLTNAQMTRDHPARALRDPEDPLPLTTKALTRASKQTPVLRQRQPTQRKSQPIHQGDDHARFTRIPDTRRARRAALSLLAVGPVSARLEQNALHQPTTTRAALSSARSPHVIDTTSSRHVTNLHTTRCCLRKAGSAFSSNRWALITDTAPSLCDKTSPTCSAPRGLSQLIDRDHSGAALTA
jgi:hypothetical protein